MRIGIHIRTGIGLDKSAEAAERMGCEAIQIFASNPSAWKPGKLNIEKVEIFRDLTDKYDIKPVVVHTPYLLNLASPDEDILEKSRLALDEAMSRAGILGASFVVTHIGSHRGSGLDQGIARVCNLVAGILDQADDSVVLLLENSAGAGDTVGSKFEDLRSILVKLTNYKEVLGVCLDSAHLWGAGYDVSSKPAVYACMEEFDRAVGLDWLKLLHLNDTNMARGSHKDRHANVGTGMIGEEGFAAIINHPSLAHLTGIIETPPRPSEEVRDIDVLKRLRVY